MKYAIGFFIAVLWAVSMIVVVGCDSDDDENDTEDKCAGAACDEECEEVVDSPCEFLLGDCPAEFSFIGNLSSCNSTQENLIGSGELCDQELAKCRWMIMCDDYIEVPEEEECKTFLEAWTQCDDADAACREAAEA